MDVIALIPQRYNGKRFLRGQTITTLTEQDARDLIALSFAKAAPKHAPAPVLAEGDSAPASRKNPTRKARHDHESADDTEPAQ